MADHKQALLGGTAIKPEGWDRSGLESLRYFLYDPKTGAIFSRTPQSWAKIVGFYLVYYSLLASFWILCLQIFFLTIDSSHPKWILDGSIIGSNPGLGRRPVNQDLEIDSSIIKLEARGRDSRATNDLGEGNKNADWARRMQLFLEPYSNHTGLFDCAQHKYNEGRCMFDMAELGECGTFPYGYLVEGDKKYIEPCIFLKLNKIYGWSPEPIDEATLDEPAYDMMSATLKEKIRGSADKNNVWIDCQGRNAADKEAFAIKYFPENQGFSVDFFPYRGGNYHSPLVAVKLQTDQLKDLQVGQLIHVECRAWYKNVKHDTKEMAGLVRYELMLSK